MKKGEKRKYLGPSREREPGIVQFHGPKLYRWAAEDLNGGLGDIPTSYLTSVLPLFRINMSMAVYVYGYEGPLYVIVLLMFFIRLDDRIFCDLCSEFLKDTEIAR